MNALARTVVVLGALTAIGPATGQEDSPSDRIEPFLRIKAGGPQSYVAALAFSPDGNTLYATGWDKVIHVWQRDDRNSRYRIRPESTFRIPLGPGLRGALNALALSQDGRWLAVAGQAIIRGGATFRIPGRVLPAEGALTPEMRLDEGVIYVFDTRDRSVRALRGHPGAVVALAFAPSSPEAPVLISAAREWNENATPAGFTPAVRAWDVLRTEKPNGYLGGVYLPDYRRRPGLAARRIGERLSQIQVGLAWGDEKFRVWDLETNRIGEAATGRFGNTVAAADGGFVTGAIDSVGKLELRRPMAVQTVEPLGGDRQHFYYPRALAAAPRGGNVDLAMVTWIISQAEQPRNQYRLQFTSADGQRFQPLAGGSGLWQVTDTAAMPSVAMSSTRQLVAVAGDSDQSIWLFSVDDIRAGQGPYQTLRNEGSSWQEVAFAKNGDALGLLLSNGSERVAFDLDGRTGISDARSWTAENAELSPWEIESNQERPATVTVRNNNQVVSRFTLPEREIVSTHAFVRVQKDEGADEVILALASHQSGQASLRLHDARSGFPFRVLTAHTQTIRKIAFSQDGRLMVTVAGDQQACLWDLSDIDTILGKHGTLPEVTVRRDATGGGAIVSEVLAGAPDSIRRALRTGDLLQSLTVDGKRRTWAGGRELLDTFWSLQPGTEGRLAYRRGRAEQETTVRIGQGIDERKPLLSLFISAPNDQQTRDWVAWTPIGPYQASRRDAERFLGWHFNTGLARRPARFAAAAEYREIYHREALVKDLVQRGQIEKKPPPPPPEISIRFGPDAMPETSGGGGQVIRLVPERMQIFLSDFPANLVGSVEVQMDDQAFHRAERVAEDAWAIEMEGVEWPRGRRALRAVVTTAESPPRQFVHDAVAQRVPLPPTITTAVLPEQVVESSVFPFAAAIKTSTGEPPEIQLKQNDRQIAVEGGQIEEDLTLQPGDNEIELVVTNAGATAGTRERETTRGTYRVTYHKAQTLPPEMEIERFQTVDSQTGSASTVRPAPGEDTLRVTDPKLMVQARIKSASELTLLAYRNGVDAERVPVDAKGGADGEWRFDEAIDLLPGKQMVSLYAQASDSDEAVVTVPVLFVPPLPKIAVTSDHPRVIQRDSGESAVEVSLTGRLQGIDDQYPFQARLLLNDDPIGEPELDLEESRWSADVKLRGGDNRIQLVLTNEWGNEVTRFIDSIEYRRLPKIVETTLSDVDREPFVDVTARVESPLDRPLSGVSINGRQLATDSWKKLSDHDDLTTWQVVVRSVPLQPGENTLSIVASNHDGDCREPATLTVTYDAAHWAPAEITFLNTAPVSSVVESQYELEARIDSPTLITAAIVELDGKPIPGDQLTMQQQADNVSTIKAQLELREGVNRVAVRAVNEGGEQIESCQISFVPPPVEVKIASVEPIDNPDLVIPGVVGEGNRLTFDKPVPSGFARLRGTVRWHGARAQSSSPPKIRIWVNSFQQRPVKLESSANQQSFDAVIVLGKKERNQVVMDLVGAPNDAQSSLAFEVDCQRPRAGQRLHLLTIGVNQEDAESLQRRALTAVDAATDENGQFQKPHHSAVFERINVYPPVNGRVTFSDVFNRLLSVRAVLDVPAGVDASGKPIRVNDVVMLYYEGGVLISTKEHFVLTTSDKYDPTVRSSAISSEWLAKFFNAMRGAQLAFIDVPSPDPSNVPTGDWKHDSHAALLCYAWSDEAAPPPELRLISAFRKALKSAGQLKEVDQILAVLSDKASGVEYHRVLPEQLKTLVLKVE